MNLDQKVKKFLDSHRGQWSEWNVSEADGKFLYDLVIKNRYTKALEIGTSTGHSAIWIAWAMSKTGGGLVTVEMNKARYRSALGNFKEAGISDYIDARLADAHELVREVKGPFDFVFSDADKEWYKNYFAVLEPKLEVGGCFTAHNVSWSHSRGIREFLEYVQTVTHFETRIESASGEGISISYKRAEKELDAV
jgi:predicted O-methyltransferase YrrM